MEMELTSIRTFLFLFLWLTPSVLIKLTSFFLSLSRCRSLVHSLLSFTSTLIAYLFLFVIINGVPLTFIAILFATAID